jgi:hypothetical protein
VFATVAVFVVVVQRLLLVGASMRVRGWIPGVAHGAGALIAKPGQPTVRKAAGFTS